MTRFCRYTKQGYCATFSHQNIHENESIYKHCNGRFERVRLGAKFSSPNTRAQTRQWREAAQAAQPTHASILQESHWSKPNLDCNYFFPIDLYLLVKSFWSLFNPNQIQIVITLLGYIKYQSEFRLVLNLYSFIFHVQFFFRILFIQPKFRL